MIFFSGFIAKNQHLRQAQKFYVVRFDDSFTPHEPFISEILLGNSNKLMNPYSVFKNKTYFLSSFKLFASVVEKRFIIKGLESFSIAGLIKGKDIVGKKLYI